MCSEAKPSKLFLVLLDWLIVRPSHLLNTFISYYYRWNMLLLVTNIDSLSKGYIQQNLELLIIYHEVQD
jgi:hypothetical protein